MKKIIISCCLVSLASTVSFAQTNQTSQTSTTAPARKMPTSEQIAERNAKMDMKRYNLPQNLYSGIYQAELDYAKQIAQLRANGTKIDQNQITQLNATKDQKFKQIMTPEQYAKYEAAKPKTATKGPAGR